MTDIALHIILGLFGFCGFASAIFLLSDRKTLQERLADLKSENQDLRAAERKRDLPEPTQTVSPEVSKIFSDHIAEKWPEEKQVCPLCSGKEWGMSGLAEFRSFEGEFLLIRGNVYPIIILVCTGCGYMLPFSAITTGLVGPHKE